MANAEAWCAHTMTARDGDEIVCCDCGRRFNDREHVERVQQREAETGFVQHDPSPTK